MRKKPNVTHTPKPWRVVRRKSGISTGPEWDHVAVLATTVSHDGHIDRKSVVVDTANCPNEMTIAEQLANGLLCAAAPDLLKACQKLVDYSGKLGNRVPSLRPILNRARAAIHKATIG
jgi:hypothetical protein